jgi:RNA polymerase sigma-70 factor, ECF subfamily
MSTDHDLRLYLLVLRCQAGDESAFAQLLTSFGGRTLAHARTLVGDDAEDVQQEVWLTVYRRLPALSNPGAFRTWLFQITRHRAIDYLRARKREREVFDESAVEAEQVAAPEPHLNLADGTVAAVFERLAPVHREALRLRYEEDLSYAEMALVLGCAVGTVRSRLHNAKRQLQGLIDTRPESGRGTW